MFLPRAFCLCLLATTYSINHFILRIVIHYDTAGPFNGERSHHGPFRNAVLDSVPNLVFAPSIGTHKLADLTPCKLREWLRGFNVLNVAGGDVVEATPTYVPTTNTVQNAVQTVVETLNLMHFSSS